MTPKTCGTCCYKIKGECTNPKSCAAFVDDTFGCIYWARDNKEIVVSLRLKPDEVQELERQGESAGLKAREIVRGWLNAQGN